MKLSLRLLCMAAIALAVTFLAATSGARAQGFPPCNASEITIKNTSDIPVLLCIKMLSCYDVPANGGITVPVPPGTEIPGIYGSSNITQTWQPNPLPPPNLWIPSIALLPSDRCFNIYFDESSCTIIIEQTIGPPCTY